MNLSQGIFVILLRRTLFWLFKAQGFSNAN